MGGNQFREEGDRHLCLAPRWLLVKSRTVGHIFTSTKHAKSLCAQIEAAHRSVLSHNFSFTEPTFGDGGEERLNLVQSDLYSPF